MSKFASTLIAWQKRHGRRGLPWQGTRDPYKVWLAEVMLQQTQVAEVIPYYERFLKKYPTVTALAAASRDEVLQLWSGLGYYARARNLHAAAREIVEQDGFPDTLEGISGLPGVGRSTAAAIAAFAFGRRAAILDGNVKRVLARCYAIENEKEMWEKAESLLPAKDVETYTQALMDLGAAVCTRARPRCELCPVQRECVARSEGRVSELPAPRPRRRVPVRRSTWIVALHANRILLERRPGAGIWGGLLSFPECDERNIAAYCRRALGCEIGASRKLPAVEHGFTHFRLHAVPVVCDVKSVLPRAEAGERLWVELAGAAAAAVPAPVRALLGRLAAAH